MSEFKVVKAFVNKKTGGLLLKGNNNEYYPFSSQLFSITTRMSVMDVKELLEEIPDLFTSFPEGFILSQKSLVLFELDLTDPILATPESWDSLLDMV